MLSIQNKHSRDCDISFVEESHEYFFRGQKIPTSVTSYIHLFFSDFDANQQADNIVNKKCKSETYEKYKNMTKNEIMTKWSEDGKKASAYGTKLHNDLEMFFNEKDTTEIHFQQMYTNDYPEYNYFVSFLQDKHLDDLEPFRTEWMVYSNDLGIAGSIDMLFRKKSNPEEYVIYDWKRSKEIKYENRFGHGKGPVHTLDDCNYIHYSLQLNMYKFLLETYYDIKVKSLHLLILHPNHDTYIKIDIPFMDSHINKLIEFRKKQLSLKK